MIFEIQKVGSLDYKVLVSYTGVSEPVYGFDLGNLAILGGVFQDISVVNLVNWDSSAISNNETIFNFSGTSVSGLQLSEMQGHFLEINIKLEAPSTFLSFNDYNVYVNDNAQVVGSFSSSVNEVLLIEEAIFEFNDLIGNFNAIIVGDEEENFNFDPQTGGIFLAKALNYEAKQKYEFQIFDQLDDKIIKSLDVQAIDIIENNTQPIITSLASSLVSIIFYNFLLLVR